MLTPGAIRDALGHLLATLPDRYTDDADRLAKVRAYYDQLASTPGLEDGDLRGAVIGLVRGTDRFPTVHQLLVAVRDERDRRERANAAEAAAAATAHPHSPPPPRSDGLRRAIESGEWDRAWARATLASRARAARHAEVRAAVAATMGEVTARRRREASLVASREVEWWRPVVTEDEVDAEVRAMMADGRSGAARSAGRRLVGE